MWSFGVQMRFIFSSGLSAVRTRDFHFLVLVHGCSWGTTFSVFTASIISFYLKKEVKTKVSAVGELVLVKNRQSLTDNPQLAEIVAVVTFKNIYINVLKYCQFKNQGGKLFTHTRTFPLWSFSFYKCWCTSDFSVSYLVYDDCVTGFFCLVTSCAREGKMVLWNK